MEEKSKNDATAQIIGTIYQFVIALKDCFKLKENGKLVIETYGDISILNIKGSTFQKEVKHHSGEAVLSDRDKDFWKTLANWYEDYDRVKGFSNYILSTTAKVEPTSIFYDWNNLDVKDKLEKLLKIGQENKKNEKVFRTQYDRIFNSDLNENQLANILEKFIIESANSKIDGISEDFDDELRMIPKENRDAMIAKLIGSLQMKVAKPPQKWEMTKKEFDDLLQETASQYVGKNKLPLPTTYFKKQASLIEQKELEDKHFVKAIQEIEYQDEVNIAISNYWRAYMTIVNYFKNNITYLESLEAYRDSLHDRLVRQKKFRKRAIETDDEIIDKSQDYYDEVMLWEAKDFGSIICNQDFFQQGVIHSIVDENKFRWKLGEVKDEHQ